MILNYDYLGENETKFENILTYWSVDQAGSNDEKNEGSKISLDCPFKDICEAAVQNPNQHSPSGPYMFHIFTDYVNYIQIKIWRKYCVCAASRDFGSHLAHSCGPEMEHRPRKLELKKCIRGCELYTLYSIWPRIC